MGMMTQAQLRPLTEAERRAVELMDIGADIDDVCAETHLGRAQVVAARDLAALWNAVKRGASAPVRPVAAAEDPEPGPVVGEAPPVDARPVISIELEPADTEPEYDDGPELAEEPGEGDDEESEPIVVGDVTDLLERGRASMNLRARDLALSVDRQLVQLSEILEADERTAQVRGEIVRLEQELAAKRAELEALLPAGQAKPVPRVRPAAEPKTVMVGGVQVDRRLYYSEAVRSWAREQGLEVASTGRMPREVVAAWVGAHPQEAVAA